MKRWLAVSALSALVALSTITVARAQGVTQPFIYQGFLTQSGTPVNNPAQPMQFRIYSVLAGGSPLWDSGALTVPVSNGLFTVQLNPPYPSGQVQIGSLRFKSTRPVDRFLARVCASARPRMPTHRPC
jgi:hypothetical protein